MIDLTGTIYISDDVDPELYDQFIDIIKKGGGCLVPIEGVANHFQLKKPKVSLKLNNPHIWLRAY